ncbi:MAG: TRAP transporter substrate-binding protein [Devosiaceae bacterium]|nr:TRAP transporter substrate-binding protein [Devosiaceae bacterium MH13]
MAIKRILTSALVALTASTGIALAQSEEETFRIVGTWSFANMFGDYEVPLWDAITEASGGSITGDVQAINELGLTGTELVRLVDTGVFDGAYGVATYIVSGNPVFEGIDLALAPGSVDQGRQIANAYAPTMEEAFAEIYDMKLLANYPFPAQVLVCNEAFESLGDLEGRKIRTYSTTLSDMAEGLGGVAVSMPLTEVPAALQRGVIDCGVSSGISMYTSKWQDVVTHLYETPVSTGMAFLAISMDRWNSLSEEAQAIITQEAEAFEDSTWAGLADSAQQGIACLTGETQGGDACRYGDPAEMVLVRDREENNAIRQEVLSQTVLSRFADRCGTDCADNWNATAGAVIGMEAMAQ